jgi:hypothetical protein
MFDIPLPVVSRLGELDRSHSSGAERLMLPARELQTMLFNPTLVLVGGGAGSTPPYTGGVWPFVKLLREYGLLAMMSFLALYVVGVAGYYSNLALKVSLSVIYLFTGGYLLNPTMAELVIMFCFMLTSNKEIAGNRLHRAEIVRVLRPNSAPRGGPVGNRGRVPRIGAG